MYGGVKVVVYTTTGITLFMWAWGILALFTDVNFLSPLITLLGHNCYSRPEICND